MVNDSGWWLLLWCSGVKMMLNDCMLVTCLVESFLMIEEYGELKLMMLKGGWFTVVSHE